VIVRANNSETKNETERERERERGREKERRTNARARGARVVCRVSVILKSPPVVDFGTWKCVSTEGST